MKKTLILLLMAMPMLAFATDFQTIYNSQPAKPTSAQLVIADNPAVQAAMQQYNAMQQAVGEEVSRVMQLAQQAAIANEKRAKSAPKMNAQQTQVVGNVMGDMMGALAAAGVSMEDLAKMSDDEIAAILMPTMAQKTGLSDAEMRKLQGMSDREAEAYVKAHPEMASRVQNSEYGQYGQTMKGLEVRETISDADMLKIEQMQANFESAASVNLPEHQIQYMGVRSWLSENYDKLVDAASYEARISSIFSELQDRYLKEGLFSGKGGPATAPAYTKDYYARINQIVDEYNAALVKEWLAKVDPEIQKEEQALKPLMALYTENLNLYAALTSDDAKSRATSFLTPISVRASMEQYIDLLKLRCEVPVKEHYEVAKYVSAQ